jgi:RND superfamily putative drug exporter
VTGLTARVLRRPKATLVAWAVAIGVLALAGTTVMGQIAPASLSVQGSQSAQFDSLYQSEFGSSAFVPVLLRGPRSAVDAQGPAVAEALAKLPHARVLSPWSDKAPKRLRPDRSTALIALSLDLPEGHELSHALDRAEKLVHDMTGGPVRAYVTGAAPLANALKDASNDALHGRERLALLVLALVLLLVLGSPVAAAIPVVAGAGAVAAGYGLISIAGHFIRVDQMAISAASMMGLALGVDYALLMVARFREEMAARGDDRTQARAAALAAARRSGRTIALAGSVLVAGMIAATAVLTGGMLVSAAVGVILVAFVSVATALVAVPPALVLLAGVIDRWRLPRGKALTGRASGMSSALLRRPALVSAVVALGLMALALPATGLRTGAPDARQLPGGSAARHDYENVAKLVGPGYAAPFEVVVVANRGTIAEPARLEALRRWQHKLSRDPDIAVVAGPGDLAEKAHNATAQAESLGKAGAATRKALARLTNGLGAAGARARGIQAGTARAGSAAAGLAQGSVSGLDGAGRVRNGIASATTNVQTLRQGLSRASTGASKLVSGSSRPLAELHTLQKQLGSTSKALGAVAPAARASANDLSSQRTALQSVAQVVGDARTAVADAQSAISSMSAWDPRTIRAKRSLQHALDLIGSAGTNLGNVKDGVAHATDRSNQLADTAAGAAAGLAGLRDGVSAVAATLRQLESSGNALASTISSLAGGGEGLAAGLSRLMSGADALDRGLGGVRTHAAEIAAALSQGAAGSGSLRETLQALGGNAGTVSQQLRGSKSRAGSKRTATISPYFTLAALDRASPGLRSQAAAAVNLDRGGIAGHLLVIPRSAPNDPATRALAERLREGGARLARKTNTRVAVGGPAAVLNDYGRATGDRLWLVIAALAGVTLLLLTAVFRSPAVALVAVLMNLLTVGAAFGILVLLFQGSSPLLGGPGYMDAIAATAIFAVMFGLSTDYQVFLLSRMRERHAQTGDAPEAVHHALRRTAHVIGGAALIMTAVFMTFAQTDVINVRQFGVGLAIAVVLDATIVRLMLLPAVMLLLGERAWPKRARNRSASLPDPRPGSIPAPVPRTSAG